MGFKIVAPLVTMGNWRKPSLVGCFVMGILNREVGEIELIPVAKGVISRWWIVLIVALVGTVGMWSQESDLAVTPALTAVERVYESRDETALLSLVGIDPATVGALPSFDNQILQVQSPENRAKVAQEIGTDAEVFITRSEQRFSLLNTAEGDGKTKFTFLSVGTPSYTFRCVNNSEENCNTAIDAYLAELSDVRKTSITSGLERIKTMLTQVAQSGSVDAQQKIVGIDSATPLITGELALLSTSSEVIGGTITTVKSSSYAFGFAGGALIGLLVALQLTIIDKRVLTLSQIAKYVEQPAILGYATSNPASLQHVAAALVARARQASQSMVVLIPSTSSENTSEISLRLNSITSALGVEVLSQPGVALISAEALVSEKTAYVVVATAKKSKSPEIIDTWSVLQSAQRSVLGVILAEPAI
jgi:hypothetical protein